MSHTLTIRPTWTPFMVVLMVLGFMFAWPLGLLVLAYILWGDRIPEFQRDGRSFMRNCCGFRYADSRHDNSTNVSGNGAFDEYREQELDRLQAERRRLDDERREFEAFVRNLRRAKDQDEFDRFMADRRAAKDSSPDL